MAYNGVERRQRPCDVECEAVELLAKTVHGNGKPGLVQDMADVKRALYGDKKNGVKGMVDKQNYIFWMLVSVIAGFAIKNLGVPIVEAIFKHVTG